MLVITLYLVAVFGLVVAKRVLGDYFSPAAIYTFFWCFALATLELGWVSFDPLGVETWGVIWGSYGAFMLGALIPTAYALTKTAWRRAPVYLDRIHRCRFERALAFLFVCGVFGFLVQLVHLHLEVGLSAFITDPQRVRDLHSNVKYLGFFDILNLANFVLAWIYLCLYRRPRRWVVLILVWALLSILMSTDRTRFFYAVIWSFFASVYLRYRIHLTRKMILGGVVTSIVLIGFFLLIAKVYVKQAYDDNMEYIKIPPKYSVLIDPYIYLTGSFPVLQATLHDENERTYGKYTFEPLVKIIEVIYPDLSRAEIVGKFYRVPVELNVATYLQSFYLDWGIPGIIVGPFVLGFLTTAFYFAMRQRKTLFYVYLMGLLGFCTTISIFVNHFTQTATWFFVLVGYGVTRYCHVGTPSDRGEFRRGIFPEASRQVGD